MDDKAGWRSATVAIGWVVGLSLVFSAPGCSKTHQKRPAEQPKAAVKAAEKKAAAKADEAVVAKKAEFVSVSVDPSAPFTIQASRGGELPAGQPTPIIVRVQAGTDAEQLATEIRPIDGVQVRDGRRRNHGMVAIGKTVEHHVVVTAPKGIAGYLAIDVAWKSTDGGGSTTSAIAITAPGATPRKRTLGRIEKDGKGNTYEVMKAEMR